MTNRYVVAVYLQDRAYGGREEGGWYYDCGEHVRTMRVFASEQRAVQYCQRLNKKLDSAALNEGRREISSVLSTGRYGAEIHYDLAPAFYPSQRPHYE
jgi:hypothetical protein